MNCITACKFLACGYRDAPWHSCPQKYGAAQAIRTHEFLYDRQVPFAGRGGLQAADWALVTRRGESPAK